MKKSVLFLAVVLSFAYTFGANQLALKKTNINDVVYIKEKAIKSFNFKAYLPEKCCAFNLTDNEANKALLIEEEVSLDFDHTKYLPVGFTPYNNAKKQSYQWIDEGEDEALDFNHKQYLPVGFNPKKELNHLFLNNIPWVDDEESNTLFDFDTMYYFKKYLKNKS